MLWKIDCSNYNKWVKTCKNTSMVFKFFILNTLLHNTLFVCSKMAQVNKVFVKIRVQNHQMLMITVTGLRAGHS